MLSRRTRSRFRFVLVSLAFLALLIPSVALAEDDPGVIYQTKTVYNFEDDTIMGDLTRPDQEFMTGRKLARHKSLIRIRENFRDKVLQSAKEL